MPFTRRHRIRDALRGTLDGRKPIWVFWPGLGPNSSGESCSIFGTAQLEAYRPSLDPEAKSLALRFWHTQQMERASLLDRTAWQFGNGLGVSWWWFPLLNLVGRKITHRTSPSIVRREFWLCSQCRSRGSRLSEDDSFRYELMFLCGWRSIFSLETPRNLEHFVAREQWT